MSIKVTVGPLDPDDILDAGNYGAGAIIRLQTATTEAGTYANVTGSGSTPTKAIVSPTRLYDMWDRNGIANSSWYRVRYENAGGTITSAWSDSFQGEDAPTWYVTGDELLAHAGITAPSGNDSNWADTCAQAINAAIAHQLTGTTLSAYGAAELYRAALTDGVGAYLDRDAPHGILSTGIDGSAVRLGADILRASVPVLRRHSLGMA